MRKDTVDQRNKPAFGNQKSYAVPTPTAHEEAPGGKVPALRPVREVVREPEGVPSTPEAYEKAKQKAREGYLRGIAKMRNKK